MASVRIEPGPTAPPIVFDDATATRDGDWLVITRGDRVIAELSLTALRACGFRSVSGSAIDGGSSRSD